MPTLDLLDRVSTDRQTFSKKNPTTSHVFDRRRLRIPVVPQLRTATDRNRIRDSTRGSNYAIWLSTPQFLFSNLTTALLNIHATGAL